jgi:hypothetical protein
MNHFSAQQLSPLWALQAKYFELVKIKKENPAGIPNDVERKELLNFLRAVLPLCRNLELMDLVVQIGTVEMGIKDWTDENYSGIAKSFQIIVTTIGWKLDLCRFAYIPNEKTPFFEQPELFGDKVYQNFKSARAEIKNAGNCLAVDLNTAAVFHLMRASEFGLRALAQHLAAIPEKWPIEFSQWSDVIKDIVTKLEPKVSAIVQTTRGHEKDAASELYNGLLADVRHLKGTRDRVMHTRESYDEKAALSVFDDVKKFMCRLADGGISET